MYKEFEERGSPRLIDKIGRLSVEIPFVDIFGTFDVDDENHALSFNPCDENIARYGFAGVNSILFQIS